MLRKRLPLLTIALLVLAVSASADTVYLANGKSVEGTIIQLHSDKLRVRTEDGVSEYGRDQVRYFTMVRRGPDGKDHVVKAMFKPKPIKMPFELKTKHYWIKTDTAEHVPKNAGRALEQLYRAYTDLFDLKVGAQKKKVEVIIFDKKEDFLKYADRLKASPRKDTLGFFRRASDGSAQIITFKRRTKEFNTLSTLYHEATHQFIAMVMDDGKMPPLWVNEGLAVFFENSRWRGGKLQVGIIPRKRLMLLQNRLRAGKYVHLADLMKRGRERYDGLCYSEGWSLVYFFVKAHGGRYARRFGRYFRMLRKGEDPDEAFKKCFTDDIDKLERAWKKFCLELEVPPK